MKEKKSPKGLLGKFLKALEAGAEKTISEWAEEFNVTTNSIQDMLGRLRHDYRQHQWHPIGTISGGLLKNRRQGVIVNIYRHKEWLVKTMDTQKNSFIDPQLLVFSTWLQEGYQKYPSLRRNFKVYLSDELTKLTLLDSKLTFLDEEMEQDDTQIHTH